MENTIKQRKEVLKMDSLQVKIKYSISFFLRFFTYTVFLMNNSIAQVDDECGFAKRLNGLRKLNEIMSRPTLSDTERTINTNHFKIHYTLRGRDSTTQTWMDSVAVYAEQCRSVVTTLGWATLPPDNNAGGDNRYDICILNTADFRYG